MDDVIYREIEQLPQRSIEQLRQRYRAVFGEDSASKHKQHLVRRIAWRLQVWAQEDLSERAHQHALVIANDADLKVQVPSYWIGTEPTAYHHQPGHKDRRLSVIGTVLRRKYGDQTIEAKVLQDGFEYQGRHFQSLSAIARGGRRHPLEWLAFFGLAQRGRGPKGG